MTECYLSAAFLGSSIYMMFAKGTNHKQLFDSLDDEQKIIYAKIKKERFSIWMKSTIAAVIGSVIIAKVGRAYFGINNYFNRACIGTLIYYMIQYMVYTLYPKSDYMLNHIKNNKQSKAWLKVYKSMKNKWHTGLIFGIIGYFLLNIIVFKNKQQISF